MRRVWAVGLAVGLALGLGLAVFGLFARSTLAVGTVDEGAASPDRGTGVLSISQISSSTVNSITPMRVPVGSPFDLCLNVTVDSPDLEYLDRFDMYVPNTWTVLQVRDVITTGCPGTSVLSGVEPGNLVFWQTDATLPSGCGAWRNGTYDFCAQVQAPDCAGSPWNVDWTIIGDGFGSPLHYATGIIEAHCEQAGLDLWPQVSGGPACHTTATQQVLNLWNNTGSDGTFSLAYEVLTGNGTISGPDQIYLGQGIDQDFIVELTPSACLLPGMVVVGEVTSGGNGSTVSAQIHLTISEDGGCLVCDKVYLPCVFRGP